MQQAQQVLKALANPYRQAVVRLLARHGELTVGEILTSVPGITQSALSQHLAILRDAEVVSVRRDSQRMHYSLRGGLKEGLHTIIDQIFEGEVHE